MFDIKKYEKELKKENNKVMVLYFLLFLGFTVLTGIGLAALPWSWTLLVGFLGYGLGVLAWFIGGRWGTTVIANRYYHKALKESVSDFIKKKGLVEEFNAEMKDSNFEIE